LIHQKLLSIPLRVLGSFIWVYRIVSLSWGVVYNQHLINYERIIRLIVLMRDS